MRKKIFIVSLLLANFAIAEDKIAIIDLQRIYEESIVAKSVAEQITKKRNEFQGDLEKKENDLSKLNQELVKQQSILSKDVFEQKVKEFNDKLSDVQREFQHKKDIIDQANIDSGVKIDNVVTSILQKLSGTKDISLVLPANTVPFYKPHLDITTEVLALLNKQLQKIDVNFNSATDAKQKK